MLKKIFMQDKYGEFYLLSKSTKIKPIISVLMSAYNTEIKYLQKSIESVLDQTFENFEFIIINDGANSVTTEFLLNYCKHDDRIKLVYQPNMGITKSLNRAIKLAQGQYIARQDTDDIWKNNKLEIQLNLMMDSNIVLIGSYTKILDNNFFDITEKLPDHLKRLGINNTKQIQKALTEFNPFYHASILINKDVLSKLGGYNDDFKYAQDYELWVRVLKEYEAYIMPEYLLYKVFHSQSITGGTGRNEQRLLGMKAKYSAMKYFGAPIHKRIRLYSMRSLLSILPSFFIQKILYLKSYIK